MTGVADIYVLLREPRKFELWNKIVSTLRAQTYDKTRLVVLSWKRTGSNLLCGILFNHPEIAMHNELFNAIDIFTYYPQSLAVQAVDGTQVAWNVRTRDLNPRTFLQHIWATERVATHGKATETRAIGFKSFPEHWSDAGNDQTFLDDIMLDTNVKKIILNREDELRVFVSSLRADVTGEYMTTPYPHGLRVHVCPAKFQAFVNHYRDTFNRLYKSVMPGRDSFRVSYEQLRETEEFEKNVLPQLWRFLNVSDDIPLRALAECTRQSDREEDLRTIISNFEHLEFCFRHTDVRVPIPLPRKDSGIEKRNAAIIHRPRLTWSILLPICSRSTSIEQRSRTEKDLEVRPEPSFCRGQTSRMPNTGNEDEAEVAWTRVKDFAASLWKTITADRLSDCETIIGIDVDDKVFSRPSARARLKEMFPSTVFVNVQPSMYGKVCRIWNLLAQASSHDLVVLLGDDVRLLDAKYMSRVEEKFEEIASRTGLPLGAACVAMNDLSFPGFPTFPVLHRWHLEKFGRLLPAHFVNQDGDPYLYELYARWSASAFEMGARVENTIGGDGEARYTKHAINWKSTVLATGLKKLSAHLDHSPRTGVCVDVVVPSYRTENLALLRRIVTLRASITVYTRFWVVVDNPDSANLAAIRNMAREVNHAQNDGNYFVSVLSYGENRGASHARNTGYNASVADWVLFLDDDVEPDKDLLDAYVGATYRYPDAKVLVGQTHIPPPHNLWTRMVAASHVTHFYGIAEKMSHPPWGVSANLMVRGSRFNHTVHFKPGFPKTGGGEDVDFVLQMKEKYAAGDGHQRNRLVVSVPGARVCHPWWNGGAVCFSQIVGWAWGDSLCMLEWPKRSFMVFPNWIECIALLPLAAAFLPISVLSLVPVSVVIFWVDLLCKTVLFFPEASGRNITSRALVALGASSIISAQELSRFFAACGRLSVRSFCRRMDWFDGQRELCVSEHKLRSFLLLCLFCVLAFLILY